MPSLTEGLVQIFGSRSTSTGTDDVGDKSVRSKPGTNIEHNRNAWSQNVVNSRTSKQRKSIEEKQGILSDRDSLTTDSVTLKSAGQSNGDAGTSDESTEEETSGAEDHTRINGSNRTENNDESEEDASETQSPASESSETEVTHAQSNSEREEVINDTAVETDDEGQIEDHDPCIFCQTEIGTNSTTEDGGLVHCKACRKPAHKSCFESQRITGEDLDVENWRCAACLAKKTSESPKDTASKPRHSASRLVRDLLPVSRGVQKPGAHSIFAQPLLSDLDDKSRALRKRKSPTAESTPRSEKRKRRSTDGGDVRIAESDNISHEGENLSHSTRRSSQKLVPTARILQHRPFHKAPPHKFILAFRLDQEKILEIISQPPKPTRRMPRKKQQKIPPPPVFQPPIPKFPALPAQHLIFPSMFGDRENEINAKPYGGILSEAEADTSRSYPQMRDREIFEIARKEAEEERRKTSAAAEEEINGDVSTITKPNRTVSGPPSKIKCIQFGKYVIDTSYAAPYPEEYSHESRLFICEFCLKYLPSEFVAYRHKLKCPAKHPPGDEIYRDGSISIWEVDGRKKTEYCQCLCLMAKLFLGSKTLYYDVDPFLFYILTEYDEFGYHFVGYFSKEKRPASQNNVSCILVMPIHQRKGYATFLIDFSYLLTRIEGKEGSPEKPLSDMGLTAYRSYWDLTISNELLALGDKPFSIKDIMIRTGMTADDVVHSLERLYAFIRDPVTKTYGIRFDRKLYETIVNKYNSKNFRTVNPDRLTWTPYIMGRSDTAILDGQPLHAVAQREEEIEIPIVTQTITFEDVEMDDLENVSPKTSKASEQSPRGHDNTDHDGPPVNDKGLVAPGPPSTDALTATISSAITSPIKEEQKLVNGASSDEMQPPLNEQLLTGYALNHDTEKIPPFRYQIDPPIPPAMLRKQTVKKRHPGTSQTDRDGLSPSTTLQPVRSSPRKADSLNGGSSRPSSRDGSPEKFLTPKRRSGRRSGLATEIIVTEESNGEDGVDQDDVDNPDTSVADELELVQNDDTEVSSEESEQAESEDSDDSADPDVEIEEDEDDESTSDAGSGSEVDVPSAPSVASAALDEDEEEADDDDDD